ncbi:unnamed protein product [Caenorhabditis angaria]|uniref:Uncharacterized protein n=1 Tax=Caenorhabditis angaria TaxID=860376 RepID=A0A9P1I544_9PELO|nr:unnamed protein product [Caenorhabditis angaria]
MKIEDVTFVFHRFEKYTQDFVKEILDLWNIHRPNLAVQLGKHENETNLVEFEKFGCDYDAKHINLDSRLDCDKIVERLNEKNDGLKYVKTEKTHVDFCSFSHFLVMNKSQKKSLAIYVPTLNDQKIIESVSDAVKIVLNK